MIEAFWVIPEDAIVSKLHNLVCQKLAQEDCGEKPAGFLGTAGPTSLPPVDAAASFLPPHAEIPQHPVSLPQSSQDDTELTRTDVFVDWEKKVR